MRNVLKTSIFTLVVLILIMTSRAYSLQLVEGTIAGTENSESLTEKQMAIQRWFAQMTFLNDGEDGWKDWYQDEKQLGLDSYRYSLAFMAYAAGAMAYKTPAYRELTADILDNSIQKLIEKRVWEFIKVYWDEEPTFPDPVAWENIMYSGHLMQIIALYESITGDMKYSTEGWDFVWDDDTSLHYTTDKLMEVVFQQSKSEETGGVPCEPNTIFIICNDHPQNAFLLYDSIHGTNYQSLAEKWRKWMEENGALPHHKGKEYLKISYLRDREMWTTGFGTPGSDGWALAWMYPWTSNPKFVCDGWKSMRANKLWKKDKEGGAYLKATATSKIFGVDDDSSTSFYPLVEKQCREQADSRVELVYEYFENNYGKFEDFNGDGIKESYLYDTEQRTRLWVTANLATSMVTDGESLRNMYREPFFKAHENEPFLKHVDYPAVWVKEAVYKADEKKLKLTILKGDGKADGDTSIICVINGEISGVIKNGMPYEKYSISENLLTITSPIDDAMEFEVNIK